MEKIDTILAALDLEPGSDAVLARAAQLASAHASKLVVLHIIEAESLSDAAAHMNIDESELRDQLRREGGATIERLIAAHGHTLRADIRIEFGSAHEVITRVAHERRAQIIVVGPGKGHTLEDRFLGSTADRVIRTSTVPILVVRKLPVKPYRCVAVAIDGSKQSAQAFIEARKLAPDAAFQLVHAVDFPLTFQQAMLRAGTSKVDIERYRVAHADKARAELSAFQSDIPDAPGLPTKIFDGEPGRVLASFSKSSKVDLLALGSQGRGAAMQALLGSVARRVLGEAACDVLVVSTRQ